MKKEITIIVLLVIIIIALILGMKFTVGNFEESDAKKFVIEDLRTKFPNANSIEVINFETKMNEGGIKYYAIKASVTEKLRTLCPERTYYYYNYPMQNFVPAPPEFIVKDCSVCESRPCIIAFAEEAIIASHTLAGTENIHKYIIAVNAVPEVSKVSEGWKVIWISENSSYEIIVNKNGYISGIQIR